MTKEVLIDRLRSWAATPLGLRRHRERGQPVSSSRDTSRGPLPSGAAGLDRAQDVSPERLRAAQNRIEALQAQALVLKHRLALLQYAAARARQFAYHDELTGLPNRRLLLDRYSQAVALAARGDGQVALLFLDLDGFKGINDGYGHGAGDQILQQVALRLRACIRSSDTACRYGGDEFVVLLPGSDGRKSALAVARKIRARLAVPCMIDGMEITVAASIGVAVFPVDGSGVGDLMRAADACMYRDKARDAAARSSASGGRRDAEVAASAQALDVLMKARGSRALPAKDGPLDC